jgi:hypothetical protein
VIFQLLALWALASIVFAVYYWLIDVPEFEVEE